MGVGAAKVTATVAESVELFNQGLDLPAVAMKKAKQVIASTVEGHLITGFMNAAPRVVKNLARLKPLLPNRGDVEKIEVALKATKSDPKDPKMPMGVVAQHLGGEEKKG